MCGVVGLIGSRESAREAFLGLTTLQHRGQDAAGILTYDEQGFHTVRGLGLVDSVFTRANMETLIGAMALGHTRYSTTGRGDTNEIQPFLINYPYGIGMVHNGNVVNTDELREELRTRWRRKLLTKSDTEILLNLFAEGLAQSSVSPGEHLGFSQIRTAVESLYQRVKGSYSVVSLIADHGLVAFRDPYGIRPLVWGRKRGPDGQLTGAHMVTSESVALDFNRYEFVRDLEPGELLYIDQKGNVFSEIVASKGRRPCMFEWVYFASPESIIDKVPVYGARLQLGKRLASLLSEQVQKRGLKPDIVVPVPETARIAAVALAEELKVPYREVLIKNRYIKRTFILDSDDKRKIAVNLKLSPVRSEIQGKKVLLIDDSIVRGTTSRKLIELVLEAGASEVYFVSTCPPIQHPCFYGIDFPSGEELIAYQKTLEEIEATLGADAVIYLDQENLVRAIQEAGQASFTQPCMACLNGQYPTDVSSGRRFAEIRRSDRAEADRVSSEMTLRGP